MLTYESPQRAQARVAEYQRSLQGVETIPKEGFARKIAGKEEHIDKHGVCWTTEMRSLFQLKDGNWIRTWKRPFPKSKQRFEQTGRWHCQQLECRRKVERAVGGRGETQWASRPIEYLCPSVPGKREQRELAGGPMPSADELAENGVRWGSSEGLARIEELQEKYPYCSFVLRDHYIDHVPWREDRRDATPELVIVAGVQMLATYDVEGRRTLRKVTGSDPQIVVYRGQLHVRSWTTRGSHFERV